MAAVKEFLNSSIEANLKDGDSSARISSLNRNFISARACPRIYTTLGTVRNGRERRRIRNSI